MTNKLVLEQLVIPVPEAESLLLTYLYFGILFAGFGMFKDTGWDSNTSRTAQFMALLSYLFFWPITFMALVYIVESFIASKNLESDFGDWIEEVF